MFPDGSLRLNGSETCKGLSPLRSSFLSKTGVYTYPVIDGGSLLGPPTPFVDFCFPLALADPGAHFPQAPCMVTGMAQ